MNYLNFLDLTCNKIASETKKADRPKITVNNSKLIRSGATWEKGEVVGHSPITY